MTDNLIVGHGTSARQWSTSQELALVPVISAEMLVPVNARAVVIAPHPDDEVLGCGGLMVQLAQLDRSLQLVSVTDGDASHPGSTAWTAARLKHLRPRESAEALTRLGLVLEDLEWVRAGYGDGAVAAREDDLTRYLEQRLRPTDVVFATWQRDGHPDHEAVGRATARAALNVGARFYELPIWAWHWADPEDPRIPWHRARKVLLDPSLIARKQQAMQAFVSQRVGDPEIGLPPVLPDYVLERLLRPFEVVFI